MQIIVAVTVLLALFQSTPREADDAAAAGANAATLHVAASGFQHARGHAIARLYRPGDNVLHAPWRQARAEIHGGRADLVFSELAFGDYAVVVLHDGNDNGEVDHNFLGLPTEPLGFSNGFKLGLFSGKPTFEKLRFTFSSKAATP
jgi:uncharacterized protein (DUF2141 family)